MLVVLITDHHWLHIFRHLPLLTLAPIAGAKHILKHLRMISHIRSLGVKNFPRNEDILAAIQQGHKEKSCRK